MSVIVPFLVSALSAAPLPAGAATLDLRPPPASSRSTVRSAGLRRTVPAVHRVAAAGAAARVEPGAHGFQGALQVFPWREGDLFQVYATPGRVTDIVLQPGEKLSGPGPVALGDTARWVTGDTLSGAGEAQRVHILVKPTDPAIATNMVINTDRRTYHLELRATPAAYMASVSWRYPDGELVALRRPVEPAAAAPPAAPASAPDLLNFHYRLDGDRVRWRPLRVYDDGRRTIIEFPQDPAGGSMPPLFVTGPDGSPELVNFRVSGRHMIVDRLFDRAELRLGAGRRQAKVRIRRGAH